MEVTNLNKWGNNTGLVKKLIANTAKCQQFNGVGCKSKCLWIFHTTGEQSLIKQKDWPQSCVSERAEFIGSPWTGSTVFITGIIQGEISNVTCYFSGIHWAKRLMWINVTLNVIIKSYVFWNHCKPRGDTVKAENTGTLPHLTKKKSQLSWE